MGQFVQAVIFMDQAQEGCKAVLGSLREYLWRISECVQRPATVAPLGCLQPETGTYKHLLQKLARSSCWAVYSD